MNSQRKGWQLLLLMSLTSSCGSSVPVGTTRGGASQPQAREVDRPQQASAVNTQGTQMDMLEYATKQATEHWVTAGGETIGGHSTELMSIARIEGEGLDTYMQAMQAFRVEVTNPISALAGPPSLVHTLILEGKTAHYLDDYLAVASFLSVRKLAIITDSASAEGFLNFFALVSNLEPGTASQVPVGTQPQFSANEWETTVSMVEGSWQAQGAFQVDKDAHHFIRVSIVYSGDGEMTLEIIKEFGLRGYI